MEVGNLGKPVATEKKTKKRFAEATTNYSDTATICNVYIDRRI